MNYIDNATKISSKADDASAAGRLLRLFLVLSFLSACRLFTSSSASAETGKNLRTEYQLKAAFLYNFMKFVEWPDIHSNPQPDNSEMKKEPFLLCVLGENDLKAPLNSLSEKTIKGRPVKIVFVDGFETFKQKHGDAAVEDYLAEIQKPIASCHLLFVGASEKERHGEILKLTEKLPVLSVSDIRSFAVTGGVIEFVTENNKMRFDINLVSAEAKKLKISSQLLQLARKVHKKKNLQQGSRP